MRLHVYARNHAPSARARLAASHAREYADTTRQPRMCALALMQRHTKYHTRACSLPATISLAADSAQLAQGMEQVQAEQGELLELAAEQASRVREEMAAQHTRRMEQVEATHRATLSQVESAEQTLPCGCRLLSACSANVVLCLIPRSLCLLTCVHVLLAV